MNLKLGSNNWYNESLPGAWELNDFWYYFGMSVNVSVAAEQQF